jgi:myxalamid-type polyketide synthase MxaB
MSNAPKSTPELSPLKRALIAIEELQSKLDAAEQHGREPIAVIGIGCRIPGGANSPDQFWRLLREGRSGIREIPADRWNVDAYYDPNPDAAGKIATRFGGFLDEVYEFEPQFFGITPREAQSMDPQQRLILETSWEALEHAGQSPARLGKSRTGVYFGVCASDYSQILLDAGDPSLLDMYFMSGIAHSIASGRLSYVLGLQGPSISVDTACSSSLVAVHLACQALRNAECRLAVAGGVNVILSPENFVTMSRARMLSPDGKCKTFDAKADGFVRGEGCGVVVLKRLSDATADGDRILAVIRGSALNQDGPSSGLTAPNGPSQESVIRDALASAGVSASDVRFVEAHGTGTSLGDPIEVQALGAVFAPGRAAASPLLIGSVKTNVGHLEAAAGVAGLIKLVLSLYHREIPRHLNFSQPSRHIAWDRLPLKVVTELMPWTPINGKRLGGVSSFGFSGTNAHIVVEEAPSVVPAASNPNDRPLHLLTLSARTQPALRILIEQYARRLESTDPCSLADFCHTANAGRAHLAHRLAISGATTVAMEEKLRACLAANAPPGVARGLWEGGDRPKIAFLFTGQGSQYAGMGKRLYQNSPTFAKALNRCDAILRDKLGHPLLEVIYPATGQSSPLDETQFTQPALFALEYALCELWHSWGVQPTFVLGHSVGEYAAACAAGVFTLEDGLGLICERARLMQAEPPGGRMAAVLAPPETVGEALQMFSGRVAIAALNGPRQTVISGAGEEVQALLEKLAAAGIKSKEVVASHAFHSPLMEPMLEPFERFAGKVAFNAPHLRLISNLTGRVATAQEIAQPSYWRKHVRQPVQFTSSMQTLADAGCKIFLEIGPNRVLLGMGRACVEPEGAQWLGSLRAGRDDWAELLASLGQLYVSGVEIDWAGFDRDYSRRKLSLPTYPFQRERFMVERKARKVVPAKTTPKLHPLAEKRLESPSLTDVVFETKLSAASPAFVADHRVLGKIVFPATAYLEAVRAAAELGLGKGWAIEGLVIGEALVLDETEEKHLQIVLSRRDDGAAKFGVYSAGMSAGQGAVSWRLHASGELRLAANSTAPEYIDIESLKLGADEVDADKFYRDYEKRGLDFGARFHGVQRVWRKAGMAVGLIQAPTATSAEMKDYGIHPALLDACVQVVVEAMGQTPDEQARATLFLPLGVESCRLFARATTKLWTIATLGETTGTDGEIIKARVRVVDDQGRLIVELRGMAFKRADRATLERTLQKGVDDWLYEIVWKPLDDSTLFNGKVAASADGKPSGRRWLILADRGGAGLQLAQRLTGCGDQCALAFARQGENELANDGDALDPASPGDLDGLISGHAALGKLHGVVYLWPLDARTIDKLDKPGLEHEQEAWCGGALHLVQAIVRHAGPQPPKLWLCTRGTQKVNAADKPLSPIAATVWGLGSVIALEQPELNCVRLDLAAEGSGDEFDLLCAALEAEDGEDQVALRAGRRWGARLQRLNLKSMDNADPLARFAGHSYELTFATRGSLENLKFESKSRCAPERGQVEIRVHATTLNFRDVMNVMGLYPGDPGAMGAECAGDIVAVGDGVTEFKVGDEVVAVAPNSFAGYVTIRTELVAKKPARLSFAEAVTAPVAFLTAHFTLNHLAKLCPGERVLIHAAAGGVGMAAVTLAKRAGAEIFATAGSPEKRALLKSLGIAHVMDSRSANFADEVMMITDGRGVDVLLNSLAGQILDRSFEVISRNGRFLELGKRGIWENDRVAKLNRGIQYFIVDWSQDMRNDPELIGGMLREIMAGLERGELAPLPHREFPLREAKAAFRFMAQGRHTGKIVLSHKEMLDHGAHGSVVPILPDATYVITGGLRGLGHMTAQWLVDRGARNLVLIGRRAPDAIADQSLRDMEAAGVRLHVAKADSSDGEAMARVLADVRSKMPPLRGVIHAAGVLDDGVLMQQNWARFAGVFAAKVTGSVVLHQLTATDSLDFLVFFSSIATVFGSPGQGNYAAANCFMDALATSRQAAGLPGLSINWGGWSGAGMAAERGLSGRLRELGFGLLDQISGFAALELALRSRRPQVVVCPADWPRLLRHFSRNGQVVPLLKNIAQQMPGGQSPVSRAAGEASQSTPDSATAKAELLAVLVAKAAPNQRRALVVEQIRRAAARVMGLENLDNLPNNKPLGELGFDSLMAVELRNAICTQAGRSLPATLLFDYPTVDAVTGYLCRNVLGLEEVPKSSERPQQKVSSGADVLDQLENLDDEEIERRLRTNEAGKR